MCEYVCNYEPNLTELSSAKAIRQKVELWRDVNKKEVERNYLTDKLNQSWSMIA